MKEGEEIILKSKEPGDDKMDKTEIRSSVCIRQGRDKVCTKKKTCTTQLNVEWKAPERLEVVEVSGTVTQA